MATSSRPRVLVTGATGFIGRPAVAALQEQGFEVCALTRCPTDDVEGLTCRADLLDAAAVSEALADLRPSHLLHLAWDLTDYESPKNLAWVGASLHLLEEFVAQGGQRAVLAGTCFEYDLSYGYCTEALTPTHPHTLYGQSKRHLSGLAHAYADAVGLSLATARLFFVYGPRQPSTQLIPYVIETLLDGRTAECSHGQQLRDYLHVADVASACAALLQSGVEGIVNVGSGEPTRLKDMIYFVADQLEARDRVALGARSPGGDETPLVVARTTRLTTEVGWTPAFTMETGLKDTVDTWTRAATPHS